MGRFFGVYTDARSWGALLYMLIAFVTGVLYFTWAVTGLATSISLALFIFGGGAINDFAFTFLIGIITGTYSSIYIASALVLWWHKGERPRAVASQVVIQNQNQTAPARV